MGETEPTTPAPVVTAPTVVPVTATTVGDASTSTAPAAPIDFRLDARFAAEFPDGLGTVGDASTSTAPAFPIDQRLAVRPDAGLPTVPLDGLGTVDGADGSEHIAIGELGVVVEHFDEQAITVVGFDTAQRRIGLGDVPFTSDQVEGLAYGPGDVVYVLHTVDNGEFAMSAIALAGPAAGTIVAESAALGGAWADLPTGALGHGHDGVIARVRDIGRTLMAYVDETGAPRDLGGPPPPLGRLDGVTGAVVLAVDDGWSLPLQIGRHPEWTEPVGGAPPPAPTDGERIVVIAELSAQSPESAMNRSDNVVARLDESEGRWWSVPASWSYAASDAAGTVFVSPHYRKVALNIAVLGDPALTWRDLPMEPLGIERTCAEDGRRCTQLSFDIHGHAVTYEPTSRRLTRHTDDPVTTVLPAEWDDAWLHAVDAGSVVYIAANEDENYNLDLVAVSLDPADPGREIARWPGVVSTSGDAWLVSAPDGLTFDACCLVEPGHTAPSGDVEIPWVDSAGNETRLAIPRVTATFTDHRSWLVRRDDLTWDVPVDPDAFLRAAPGAQPTDDGGLLLTVGQFSPARRYHRLTADGAIRSVRIDSHADGDYIEALEPAGTVIVVVDGRFVRIDPFALQPAPTG